MLSTKLEINESDLFYLWAARKINQRGELDETWQYFFHGYECDIRNKWDKRLVRIEFGPMGRIDTFTSWGLYKFIETSILPWKTFEYLLELLPTLESPEGEIAKILDSLNSSGLVALACDAELDEVSDSEKVLCRRFIISQEGYWVLGGVK